MREALDKNRLKGVYDRIARRYDLLHTCLTARSDQRGRRMVVDEAVSPGDQVLDCGAGTGSTALLAADRVGPDGKVTLFDMSDGMLSVARERAAAAGVLDRFEFRTGDMLELPFEDNCFDTVLSTYSVCPLYDPTRGAQELYRVARPGGRIGVAHSVDPERAFMKWLADRVEGVAWHFPSISMGCRSVSVLPALEQAGGKAIFKRRIGVPLWPFIVFVVEKPKL
ncbi:MAG: class I SAM-dependent methyltransferase [Marinobacter sp.]|nr:class I SAM-dependent methyltransferase [Marinobacter sp.]